MDLNISKITILGYGRFSKTIVKLLGDDFAISIYDPYKNDDSKPEQGITFVNTLEQAFANNVIIYSIPINKLENALIEHLPFINNNHILIDVLSVKEYSKTQFAKIKEKTNCQILVTHPLFGPDSTVDGFENKKVMLDPTGNLANDETINKFREYIKSKGLLLIETTSKEHDEIMSKTQSLVHFVGRGLIDFEFPESELSTKGGDYLKYIKHTSLNDTYELFENLHLFNKYAVENRIKFISTLDEVHSKLLKATNKSAVKRYGIQGGLGSFNEVAINDYLKRNKIEEYKIEYLYTTENVLKSLENGDIDYGLFAVHNSVGGIVNETVLATAKYKYKIVQDYGIPIHHFLMKRKDVNFEDINSIVAHPQVLKQCKNTLEERYHHLNLSSGLGEDIDTAKMAKNLSEGKIERSNAILGPKILADIYDFDIVAENLQDQSNNITYFLLVTK